MIFRIILAIKDIDVSIFVMKKKSLGISHDISVKMFVIFTYFKKKKKIVKFLILSFGPYIFLKMKKISEL